LVTESDEPRIQKEYLFHNKNYIFLSKKKGCNFYPYLKLKDSLKYKERQMSMKRQ
jgi:hypothetical protein